MSSDPKKKIELSFLSDTLPAIVLRDTVDGEKMDDEKSEIEQDEAAVRIRAKKTAKNKKKKEGARRNREAAAESAKSHKAHQQDDDIQPSFLKSIQEELSMRESYKPGFVETEVIAQTDYHPSTSPFVEVKPTSGRGLGVFSLRNFEKGDVVFREASLLPESGGTSILLNEASFILASDEKKARFNKLYTRCNCAQYPCLESSLCQIFNANCFKFERPGETSQLASNRVYELASRLNHSCQPNTCQTFTKEKHLVLRAIRTVDNGDELTIDYCGATGIYNNREERQIFLEVHKSFECRCDACLRDCLLEKDLAVAVVMKGRSPEQSVPDTQIIGSHTAQEVTASQQIKEWARHLVSRLPSIKRDFEAMLRPKLGDITDQNRNAVVIGGAFAYILSVILQEEDRFGLYGEATGKFFEHTQRQLAGEYHSRVGASNEELMKEVFDRFGAILMGGF